MKLLSKVYNPYQENSYVLGNADGLCVVVDPGMGSAAEFNDFSGLLEREGLKPVAILITHAHPDHICGVSAMLEKYGNPTVYMHPDDKVVMEATGAVFDFIPVCEGQTIDAAGLLFEVISTPGHSPGSVCYLLREQRLLLSGDTLFAGTIGRTDLPGGDYDAEMSSILGKLMILDGDIRLLPGHGPDSTIADESTGNPFLEPFNEEISDDFPEDIEPIVLHR